MKKINQLFALSFSYIVLLVLIPIRKKCTITCAGKTDGMGAQVQAIYSAMLYANAVGVKYCHTPIHSVEHNYNNTENFNTQVEDFYSLSLGEQNADDFYTSSTTIYLDNFSWRTIVDTAKYLLGIGNSFLFVKSHFHNYANLHTHQFTDIKARLRNKYYHNKQQTNHNNEILQVIFHVRRGDVSATANNERFTSNSEIYDKIIALREMLDKQQLSYSISIYSQGNKNDFDNLDTVAQLHLNGDVFSDFSDLVNADILVTSKSAYSYAAAILSNAIIIYEPFYHKKLPDWILYSTGIFNTKEFISLIKRN